MLNASRAPYPSHANTECHRIVAESAGQSIAEGIRATATSLQTTRTQMKAVEALHSAMREMCGIEAGSTTTDLRVRFL